MAGTIGLVQNDIKRVLAYSTVSQLGYMFLAMGVGAYAAGIFHLYTHAFFKALLFLGSGAVIHALAGEQDMRHMGGLKKYLPITYWTFLIGALAIAGVPLLAGFFSKDEILYKTFVGTQYSHGSMVLWIVGAITSLLTAIYMFRLVFLTFHGERRDGGARDAHGARRARAWLRPRSRRAARGTAVDGHSAHHPGDRFDSRRLRRCPARARRAQRASKCSSSRSSKCTDGAPAAAAAAAVAAPQGSPVALAGQGRPGTRPQPLRRRRHRTHADGLSTGIAVAGIGIALYFWLRQPSAARGSRTQFSGVHRLLLNKYHIDEIYDAVIVQPIKQVSTGALWKGMDAGLIDGTVNGVGASVQGASTSLRRLQTGSVRTYAASLFFGAVLILGWYLWS